MKENTDRTWFINASKERVKKSEERALVQKIADSISARRHRDLLDILSKIEQVSGWHTAIQYLISAGGKTYLSNMGPEGPDVCLEPLKYREVIFNIFHCEGLEPVAIDTRTLLEGLSHEESIVDSMHAFTQKVEELAWNQINEGDSLFFSPPYDNKWVSEDLENHILESQVKKINNLTLWKIEDRINIEPLWFSELGRQALSSIDNQGPFISSDELSQVLTVIQVSPKIQPKILDFNEHKAQKYEITSPSHPDYKILLNSIIEKDANNLRLLGSKHSIPSLNCILYNALKHYEINPSRNNYQNLLTNIISHVAIRALDSVSILEQLSQLKDKRVATISVIALSNFSHESAALALVNLICNKRINEVVRKALTALENLCTNSPESVFIIKETLNTNCTNYSQLKRLYSKISKK